MSDDFSCTVSNANKQFKKQVHISCGFHYVVEARLLDEKDNKYKQYLIIMNSQSEIRGIFLKAFEYCRISQLFDDHLLFHNFNFVDIDGETIDQLRIIRPNKNDKNGLFECVATYQPNGSVVSTTVLKRSNCLFIVLWNFVNLYNLQTFQIEKTVESHYNRTGCQITNGRLLTISSNCECSIWDETSLILLQKWIPDEFPKKFARDLVLLETGLAFVCEDGICFWNMQTGAIGRLYHRLREIEDFRGSKNQISFVLDKTSTLVKITFFEDRTIRQYSKYPSTHETFTLSDGRLVWQEHDKIYCGNDLSNEVTFINYLSAQNRPAKLVHAMITQQDRQELQRVIEPELVDFINPREIRLMVCEYI